MPTYSIQRYVTCHEVLFDMTMYVVEECCFWGLRAWTVQARGMTFRVDSNGKNGSEFSSIYNCCRVMAA